VQCGGWEGSYGYEYLGENLRYFQAPQHQKCFLFISGAFREKSGVLFNLKSGQGSATTMVEEMANVCAYPLKVVKLNEQKLGLK